MGYRNYIYKISKDKYESLKNKKLDELIKLYGDEDDEDGGYIGSHDILKECDSCIIELGKYIDEALVPKNQSPFFTDKKAEEELNCEQELTIISHSDLKKLITQYHKIVLDYLKNDLEDDGDDKLRKCTSAEKMKKQIQEEIRWLEYINLDKDKEDITTSWMYQHQLFNLIHKYKNLKEDDILVWAGW